MKGFIIGLFCLALGIDDGLCQGKGRVLVSSTDSNCYTLACRDSLIDALKPYYAGEIVTNYGPLPDSLYRFDALFLVGLIKYNSENPQREFSLLRQYLEQGGKLYFESSWFFYEEDTIFSHMIGTTSQGNLQMMSDIEYISGKDGYFTEGIKFKINRKLFMDHPSILHLDGPREQVLSGAEAFQYQTDTYKVVYHWHLLNDYYPTFIAYVACNYFGLCNPLTVNEPNQSETDFSVAYDPLSNKLIVENAAGFSTLAIYNTLGVKLFERNIFERRIELPNELPAGNYFVVATGVGRLSTKGIIVWK
jgi:hypothetical protein